MYCTKCGSQLSEADNFCSSCGGGRVVGFSSRINDPAFDRYRKNSKSWSYIFSFILALIAVIAFPIYGKTSGEVDWPYSLYYGMGIGGMFIVIATAQAISRSRDTTWDGVVIDKKHYKKKQWDKNTDTYDTIAVFEYYVKRENGKVYYHRTVNDSTVYDYYNIGDKVRHHKGLGPYEKYDKSKDTILFCTACSSLNDISGEKCFRCGCPLLK